MRGPRVVPHPVWITAYAVGLLLVLSFIAFDVLDLDGSDFGSPARSAMSVKVTEPEQDIRRAAFQTPIAQPIIAPPPRDLDVRRASRPIEHAAVVMSARVTISRDFRTALPRSLLPEPALSV